jgi:hypothetical protein
MDSAAERKRLLERDAQWAGAAAEGRDRAGPLCVCRDAWTE